MKRRSMSVLPTPFASSSVSAAKAGSLGKASFTQAAAEALPFADASYDVVTCTYMLHEVPLPVRKAFFAEAHRVLKPGGVLVINDSIQLGDRPSRDPFIGNFGDFSEPWYRCYIRTDLGKLGEDAGFKCGEKWLGSASKALSFRKADATMRWVGE